MEKPLQRAPHLAFFLDDVIHELLLLDVAVSGHQGAAAVVLVDLAVAEQIAALHKLHDQLDAAFVVARQVVAVREMERVDVVAGRGVAGIDDFQRFLVHGRADRAAAFAAGEKLLLADFFGLRMMGEKHDFHLFILPPQKAGHPEEKTARAIFFERAHTYDSIINN